MKRPIRWLRDLLLVDPGLKVLAIAAAVLIDLLVHRNSVHDADVTVPIHISGLGANQIYVGTQPETARLRVRGRRVALAELKAATDWSMDANLTTYRDGERFAFDPRQIEQQLPVRSVEVVAVEPASLDVRLDTLESRTLPVEAVLTGEAAAGFRAGTRQVAFEPATVQVTGPQSKVRKLTAVRTEPIDLSMTDRDIQVQVRLVPTDPRIRTVPEEVHATVQVEEQDLTRTLVGVPITVRGCPSDMICTLEPPEINVKVEGLGRAVRAFLAQPTEGLVVADVAGADGRADQTVRLQGRVAKGVVLQLTPAVAKLAMVSKSRAPARTGEPVPPAAVDKREDALPTSP